MAQEKKAKIEGEHTKRIILMYTYCKVIAQCNACKKYNKFSSSRSGAAKLANFFFQLLYRGKMLEDRKKKGPFISICFYQKNSFVCVKFFFENFLFTDTMRVYYVLKYAL